jgi:hypothetical protein
MKISVLIAIAWAVLTLGCLGAAQESNREIGSVDASVHASVEEQTRQPEPGSAKRPATLSSWSSQPAKQLGTTTGWSALATAANPAGPGTASKSLFSSFQPGTQGAVPAPQASGFESYSATRSADKLRKPTSAGGIFPREQARGSSMFSVPGVPGPPSGAPFEIQEFPSPFKKAKPALTDNFSQIDAFPGQGLKTTQLKPRPARSADFGAARPLKSKIDGQH